MSVVLQTLFNSHDGNIKFFMCTIFQKLKPFYNFWKVRIDKITMRSIDNIKCFVITDDFLH